MIILGIDPGYATIGYGVISKDGGNLSAVDYGVIQTPKEYSRKACHARRRFNRYNTKIQA